MVPSLETLEQGFQRENSCIFHYIVDSSIDAILTTDPDLKIVYSNGACNQLLAYALTGLSLRSIWLEDDLLLLDRVADWVKIGGFFSAARLNGFHNIIDLYPGIEIVGTLAADWNREKGRQMAEQFLNINPPGSLDAIWAASSEMALGAMLAVEAAGRQQEVGIFSNGVTPESCIRVREGRLIAETHHGFAEWGWYGIKFSVMVALGQAVPRFFDIRPRTMYTSNVHQFCPGPELEPIDWEAIKAKQDLPDKIVIGWIQMADAAIYQTATHFREQAAADARQHGIKVEVITRIPSTSEDFIGQAAIIEDYISEQVDVIIFSTVATDGIKNAIRKANQAGIPVIIVNQLEPIEGVEVACYLGCNNTVAGEISAYAVVNYLGGPGIIGKGEPVETRLDLPWWQALYKDIDPKASGIKGRVAIIEGISGSWRGENRLVRSDGHVICADSIIFPIYDRTGQFMGFVASFRDATNRKHAEEQLRAMLEEEQRLRALRERFITNMSHEIRTPLAIINNAASLLHSYGDVLSDEKRAGQLNVIMEQVQAMVQMLQNILTVRKAEKGCLQFFPQPIDLKAVCQAIIDDLRLTLMDHQIDFQYEGHCGQTVMDSQLILHIVTNLLSNAIKYSPNGGIIIFKVWCTEDSVYIMIQDHGIGIPQNEQEHIFEDFYRAENVESIRGTGLGLSIVQHSVQLHGGTISLESAVGVGTTFTVRLPIRPKVFFAPAEDA